jgi:hypothetical protein
VLLAAPACAERNATSSEPSRSPTLDYPLPPLQTADGHVLGADQTAPEVKLATSPRAQLLPEPGLLPAAQPPTKEQPGAAPAVPNEDPVCKTLGISDEARKARCKPPAAKQKPR